MDNIKYIDREALKKKYDITNWDKPYGCSFEVIDRMPVVDAGGGKQAMSPEEFAARMREIVKIGEDVKWIHVKMDELLTGVLTQLGYSEGCDIFRNAERWYG